MAIVALANLYLSKNDMNDGLIIEWDVGMDKKEMFVFSRSIKKVFKLIYLSYWSE